MLPARTNGRPSRLQEAPELFAPLFMWQKFAALQRGLASLDGFDEPIFFLEVARNDILDRFLEIAAFLGRALCEASFKFRLEVNFHALTIHYCTARRIEIPTQT